MNKLIRVLMLVLIIPVSFFVAAFLMTVTGLWSLKIAKENPGFPYGTFVWFFIPCLMIFMVLSNAILNRFLGNQVKKSTLTGHMIRYAGYSLLMFVVIWFILTYDNVAELFVGKTMSADEWAVGVGAFVSGIFFTYYGVIKPLDKVTDNMPPIQIPKR